MSLTGRFSAVDEQAEAEANVMTPPQIALALVILLAVIWLRKRFITS